MVLEDLTLAINYVNIIMQRVNSLRRGKTCRVKSH